MTVTLFDARSDSLTVSWTATEGVSKYILEYKTADDDEFALLSDKLSQPQARKRHLTPGKDYFFRVAAVGSEEGERSWQTHSEPFACLSTDQDEKSMAAPKVTNAGSNQAFNISWIKASTASESYELQMRENQGGEEWMTIAPSLSGTEVKKKNLTSKFGYQFRLRPASGSEPFSPPSEVMVARGLSQGIQRFFNSLDDGTLLRSGQQDPVPLADALGGKEFVLLYASAHWCPPCRQFTPMLANWYKMNRKYAEIVFLSCDHDAPGFKSYFASHPWMAVDYDDDARDNLMAAIKVSGIPRLVVLSGKTGRILVDNAVGQPLDVNTWRSLDK
jgi:thiol-disulfide isomerase/thioredoxin